MTVWKEISDVNEGDDARPETWRLADTAYRFEVCRARRVATRRTGWQKSTPRRVMPRPSADSNPKVRA